MISNSSNIWTVRRRLVYFTHVVTASHVKEGVVSVTILTTVFLLSQNSSFSANWIWREVVDVFVMTPADGL
jgi:hypothetical protein